MFRLGFTTASLSAVRAHTVAELGDLHRGPLLIAQAANEAGDHGGLADIARMSAHHHQHQAPLSISSSRRFRSANSRRRSGSLARLASVSRCCFNGRAGVPHTVSPERTIFELSTPQPE